MTTEAPQTRDAALRQIFAKMDAHKAQEIREAYHKAAEGLYALAEALEIADAAQPETGGPLIEEHLIACEAIEAMKRSRLGAAL